MLFFFNDTATTEIYTLSLHDALPISVIRQRPFFADRIRTLEDPVLPRSQAAVDFRIHRLWSSETERRFHSDRKSTRLNSSHANISYAVFCLKKKKTTHYSSVTYYRNH